ncbi:Rhomboid-like protein 19 [Cyberlindnera fabianii]|uniref:Rhomboid-like protein 19 n=1 Tax=Cyberlindnera fabianii TaxID=36022 RepID=A0A1V2L784_CYBFA|nr:Rhomboid-like protein 19 [Cyberlindnera fabianii]
MARSGIPPVTRIYLISLTVCSLLTFVLRYSAYIHLVSAEVHDEDHEHLINAEDPGSGTPQQQSVVPSPHDIYVPLIALVPGHTSLLLKPWTLFTSAFIEDNFISFITAFFLILYTGRYIEVLWGSREFFFYLTSNVLAGNAISYAVYGFRTLTSEDEGKVIQITGTSAIVIALLVAIKQRIPNHYLLFLNGFIRLKVSLVPFLVLFTATSLSLVFEQYKIISILSWTGFITSWVFLRFFKEGGSGRQLALIPLSESSSQTSTAIKGDRTSQFAMATFFPYPLSLLISFISNKVFILLCNFKMIDPESFTNDNAELETTTQELSLSSNISQSDIVSTMSQSRIFTSSSLAGVSGSVSPLNFPKGSILQKFTDGVFGALGGGQKKEADGTLDKRRRLALMQLDAKLGGGDQSSA